MAFTPALAHVHQGIGRVLITNAMAITWMQEEWGVEQCGLICLYPPAPFVSQRFAAHRVLISQRGGATGYVQFPGYAEPRGYIRAGGYCDFF